MKNEIQTAIDQIRILLALIETGELEECVIQYRANFICSDLEGIADRLPEDVE
jgi:hypothetical protein